MIYTIYYHNLFYILKHTVNANTVHHAILNTIFCTSKRFKITLKTAEWLISIRAHHCFI